MPSELTFKAMNTAHRLVMRVSGGRLGWFMPGYRMPVVELTTTGRKSGQPRTTMLTSPYVDGATVTIVPSAGGNDHHPDWYLNILADPAVTVRVGGQAPQRMRAETASAEERAHLWPIITRDHANYAGYQRRTAREIPVVLLRPEGA